MFSISSEAKVGLFILASFIVLGYLSFQVSQRGLSLKQGYSVSVVFDNVAGLSRDASVQIAGVEVGRVQSIELKDGKALVTLRITPSVQLERDVTASIKTHGVLGDKYVEILPGTRGQAFLEEGARISLTERSADIDKLLNQVGLIAEDVRIISSSLSRTLGSAEGERSMSDILENTRQLTHHLNNIIRNSEAVLRATLENARDLTDNLNKVVLSNEAAFKVALENTKSFTGNLNSLILANEGVLKSTLENTRDLTGNLNRIVTKNDEKITKLLDGLQVASREIEKTFSSLTDITESIKKGEGTVGKLLTDGTTVNRLNKTLASLQEVADKINQGKGTIGKLINEEETVKNINQGLSGINRYVTRAEQFRTFLSYKGEYLFDKSNMKSYLDVMIKPNADKFYVLGVVADPRGKRTITERTIAGVTTKEEEWDKSGLLFNAQIGKRFKDVVAKGGLFESTGGFGLDFFSMKDNLKLSFEAFDFSDDRRPHLKAAAEYRLLKHLYLSAGWDDFISNRGNSSPFAGLSIRFEDDDLKYLLTSTPIPK